MYKVLHLAKYYFPKNGGIESVTRYLADGFKRLGFFISVICFHNKYTSLNENVNCVSVFRMSTLFTMLSQPISLSYIFYVVTKGRGFDLIHLHLPNFVAILSALLLPKKIKLVVHWHSDIIKKGPFEFLLKPLQLSVLRRSSCIIATSKEYANSSPFLIKFPEKVRVVPIGIPDPKVKLNPIFLPLRIQNINPNHKIILSVGRMVVYKGFDILIKAAKKLPDDISIVLVGEGPEMSKLKLLSARERVIDKIIFLGNLSKEELSAVFARANLFCLTSNSRAEAFGVVLVEAMAFGLPIVATNIKGSGVSWVNQHGVTGVNVEVNDSNSIALACTEILNSESLCKLYSAGARNRYLSNFTDKKMILDTLDVYNSIIYFNK